MKRKSSNQSILDWLLAAGKRSQLPLLWSGVPATGFVDIAFNRRLLGRLVAKFSREDLQETKVIEVNRGDKVTWNRLLVANPRFITAVRTERDGKADDLLAGPAGALIGRPAWARALNDHALNESIAEKKNQVFVAGTAEDFAIERSIGLPVIPPSGLDCVAEGEIEVLRRLLDVPPQLPGGGETAGDGRPEDCGNVGNDLPQAADPQRMSNAGPADACRALAEELIGRRQEIENLMPQTHGHMDDDHEEPSSEDETRFDEASSAPLLPPPLPLSVVLMNFSLARLDRGDIPVVVNVADHLLALHRDHGLPLDEVCVWKPSATWLARLTTAVESGDFARVGELLGNGIADDFTPLADWPDGAGRDLARPASYSRAFGQFIGRGRLGDELDEADRFDELQAAYHETIGKRLLELAEQTADPLRANQMAIVATESILSQAAAARLLGSQRGSRGVAGNELAMQSEPFKQFLELSDRAFTHSAQLRSWNRQTRRRRR